MKNESSAAPRGNHDLGAISRIYLVFRGFPVYELMSGRIRLRGLKGVTSEDQADRQGTLFALALTAILAGGALLPYVKYR